MPGDSVTEDLVVTNAGTAELRYAMTTTATTALGDELDLEVRDEDVDGGCDDFDGGVVVAAGTTLDGAAFGSSAQGQDAGDRVLAGGASETLCFRVDAAAQRGHARPGPDVRRRRSRSTRSRPSTTRNPHVGCTRPARPTRAARRGRTRSPRDPRDEEEQRNEDSLEGLRRPCGGSSTPSSSS